MNLQYSGEPGSSLELEETAPTLEKLRHPKRIPVKCRQRNRFIPAFLIGVAVLSLVSLLYLGIDWGKMASRKLAVWQLQGTTKGGHQND